MASYYKHDDDNRLSLTIYRVFVYIVLILLVAISLFPFIILIVNSTRAHADIQKGFSLIPGTFLIKNFKSMLANDSAPVLTGIRNSLIVSSCVALFSCYFSALTAYAIHAYNFKLKKFAFGFILAIMMIPSQISTTGFLQLINKMGLNDSYIPLIVPSIAAPAVFFFMKQYMESALPLEIVEASRIDGAGEFKTFNRIVMPIMKPALSVQAIVTFVGAWNNYFVPALVIESMNKKTMPIVIATIRSADFAKFDVGQLYMTIAFAIVPILIVYLFLSKYIVEGVAMGSVKG